MAGSQSDVAAQIKATLSLSEPDLDTSVGTVVGKIIDAVAGSISTVYMDQQLLSYTYDINSKADADLDAFVQLFSIARMPAVRSTGTVTFTRSGGDLSTTAFIPIGSQVADSADPQNIFQTVTGALLSPNVTSVNVPIQAVLPGSQANVSSRSITNILTPLQGVTSVTNLSATSGGQSQETDSALRARFTSTVFRNLAGTEQMYLGSALSDPDCYAANVVSASKLYRDQIQFTTTTVSSTVNDAKYVYNTPVALGTDIDNGALYNPGSDYTFTPSVPPTVTADNTTSIPTGTVADLEFQYCPTSSRNDPANGIVNRVDVFCGGNRDLSAQQTVVFNTGVTFNSTSSSAYYANNYQRTDGTTPTVGNVFVPLAFGPIATMSPTVTIGGTTYGLVTPSHPVGVSGGITYAYRIVHDVTANGMTPVSNFGLEWDSGHLPANHAVFTVGSDSAYTYNDVPTGIQKTIDSWRLLGIDARAHQALYQPIKFCFAVVYDRGFTPSLVNSSMDATLTQWLSSLGIDSAIQVSDVIQLLHNVPGVDNIRFLNTSDDVATNGIAIQLLSMDGTLLTTYTDTNGRAKDVYFTDNQLPVFGGSRYVLKAKSSFGNL